MLRKTLKFTDRARAYGMGICAFAWMGAVGTGCSGGNEGGDDSSASPDTAGDDAGSPDSGRMGGSQRPLDSGMQVTPEMQPGRGAQSDSGPMTNERFGDGGTSAEGGSASGSGGMVVEATCGPNDRPEEGIQGDVNPGTVNCGLTLLSEVPGGGSVQGSGHCAYVRSGSAIKAYSLADPLMPVETDQEPTVGASESMRAHTVDGRAILVSGSGVYDISNCEDLVKKGEIAWPSTFYQLGLYVAAISGHEISISHDAKRVYSGLGFVVADIANLEQPDTWTVKTGAAK